MSDGVELLSLEVVLDKDTFSLGEKVLREIFMPATHELCELGLAIRWMIRTEMVSKNDSRVQHIFSERRSNG